MSNFPEPNFNINTNPTGSPTLGSVTHKFRKKNFKAALVQARWILIIFGVWSLVSSAMTYGDSVSLIEREIREVERSMPNIDERLIEKARREAMSQVMIFVGVEVAIGVIFILGGVAIKTAPVPIAIGCLVVFAAFHGILALLFPASIFMGLLGKVIFVAALVIVVRSTALYQSDLRRAQMETAALAGTMPLR